MLEGSFGRDPYGQVRVSQLHDKYKPQVMYFVIARDADDGPHHLRCAMYYRLLDNPIRSNNRLSVRATSTKIKSQSSRASAIR
jgi:hypothetical protein